MAHALNRAGVGAWANFCVKTSFLVLKLRFLSFLAQEIRSVTVRTITGEVLLLFAIRVTTFSC